MNPTTNQQAVRAKAEAALAAFVRNFYDVRGEDPAFDKAQLDIVCRRAGSVLNGLRIYEGQTPLSFTMPCVVVNASGSSRLVADADTPWSEVSLDFHVMDQLEEGNEGTETEGTTSGTAKSDAARLHAERVGAIVELLDNETLVMTQLNKQSGIDTRPIKSFSVFGYWLESDQPNQYDLHWDDVFTYKYHCSPLDPE